MIQIGAFSSYNSIILQYSSNQKLRLELHTKGGLTDGKEFFLRYVSFSEKILHGKVWKDDKTSMIINEPFDLQIPLEKIKNVRVWKPNTALTIGIPLGILGVTVLIGLLLIESEGIGISW